MAKGLAGEGARHYAKNMNAHRPAPGPDLLSRYLNAYLQARQLADVERPWGLGDDQLDSVWARLSEALAGDPAKLNRIVAEELSDDDRARIVENLAPLIFALPLRTYPAVMRALKAGPRLIFTLNQDGPLWDSKPSRMEWVGYLPAALTDTFVEYLRRVLRWKGKAIQSGEVTISSGGRRRRVNVCRLAGGRGGARGIVVRFIERLPSPADE